MTEIKNSTIKTSLDMSRRHSYSNIHQLFLSIANGNSDKQLLHYLQRGNVNIMGPGGDNLLLKSIKDHNTNRIDLLLKHKCDASKVNENGETPLYLAVCCNNLPLCKKLIDAGAQINSKDVIKSALPNAVLQSNLELVKLLMENGADCNAAASFHIEYPWASQTALMLALNQQQDTAIVETILSYKTVDLDKQLRLCYVDKFQAGVSFFLAKGGNPFIRGKYHMSIAEKVLYGLVYPQHDKRFRFDDWCVNQLIIEYGHVTEFSHRNFVLSLIVNCETLKMLMRAKQKNIGQLTLRQSRFVTLATQYFPVLYKLLDHLLDLGLFLRHSDILIDAENAFGCGTTGCLLCEQIREELRKRVLHEPPSLFSQCKTYVRSLWSFGVSDKVKLLPLPMRMKDILCFSDIEYIEF